MLSECQVVPFEQFLEWTVKHQCIDSLDAESQRKESEAYMAAELRTLQGEFGDIYFEDLAKLLFSEEKRIIQVQRGGQDNRGTKVSQKLNRAVAESIDRLDLLKRGIKNAFDRNTAFPALTPMMLRELVSSAQVEHYYVSQVTHALPCTRRTRLGILSVVHFDFLHGDDIGWWLQQCCTHRTASTSLTKGRWKEHFTCFDEARQKSF